MTNAATEPGPPRNRESSEGFRGAKRTQNTLHQVEVDAPVDVVYGLLARAEDWPHVFGPTVHAEREPVGDSDERLRLWAFANGDVRTWQSHRILDPAAHRIRFYQLTPAAPLEHMGGEWVLTPRSPTSTAVALHHDFRTIDDDPEQTAWIRQATDRNSNAELGAVKRTAELGDHYDEVLLSFTDTVTIDAGAAPVYEFLNRADEWPQRLPHVARLALEEPTPGVQAMEMDTVGGDGSLHTTRSVRLCFPHERILYKQTTVPPIMTAHTGAWTIREIPTGVEVTSTHTVVIEPAAIAGAIGPEATVRDARTAIQEALSTNSLTTLRFAKEAAENAM